MRMSCSFIIAGALLLPLQAMAQSGTVGGSGSGTAGVTTGTAPSTAGSSRGAMPNSPGTNSLGTAQSSGGVTTGSAAGNTTEDKKIQDENRHIDQKLKGICRGC
jgi:hypothetical protein